MRKEARERQKRKPLNEESVAHHGGRGQGDDRSDRTDHILAKEAGVSHKTVSQVSKILDHATEETKQQLKEGKPTTAVFISIYYGS